ncbi:hypothetical protein [Derxia gummosa]|uniref:Uncharacterized protein n=1 Tax=Derxia gummosa DSM 723 TaxID=1121388 RepID=A0A8B6X3K9_9BURK|nr:hypothetical protein [Derxia gummosa]
MTDSLTLSPDAPDTIDAPARYGVPPSLHVDVYLEGEREFWRLDEPTLVHIDGQPLVLPPDLSAANLTLTQAIAAPDGATVVLLLRDRVATTPGAAPNGYVAVARRFAKGEPPVCVFFHDALDAVDASGPPAV